MMMIIIIILIIIIIIILKMKITPEKMDMICILEIPTGKPARDAASTQWKTRIWDGIHSESETCGMKL